MASQGRRRVQIVILFTYPDEFKRLRKHLCGRLPVEVR